MARRSTKLLIPLRNASSGEVLAWEPSEGHVLGRRLEPVLAVTRSYGRGRSRRSYSVVHIASGLRASPKCPNIATAVELMHRLHAMEVDWSLNREQLIANYPDIFERMVRALGKLPSDEEA